MITQIVKGEDLIPKKILFFSKDKSYVASKEIWIDPEEDKEGFWAIYFYQNTLIKKDGLRNPLEAVKEYGGSSIKGKNVPQEQMLAAEKNSSKPTKTSILFWGTSKKCAPKEQ